MSYYSVNVKVSQKTKKRLLDALTSTETVSKVVRDLLERFIEERESYRDIYAARATEERDDRTASIRPDNGGDQSVRGSTTDPSGAPARESAHTAVPSLDDVYFLGGSGMAKLQSFCRTCNQRVIATYNYTLKVWEWTH